MKKMIFFFVALLLTTFTLTSITLYFFPVKHSIDLNEDLRNKLKNKDDTIIVCSRLQITGGDWWVHEILCGDDTYISKDIFIIGNCPQIDYSKYSNGLPGGDKFIFIGKFIPGEPKFVSYNWDVITPYVTNGIIFNKRNWLNIFDIKKFTTHPFE